MVKIVTGKINSGKTSRLFEIYLQSREGDGIISKKYMIGSDVFGFNAFILSDGSEFPYMIHEAQMARFKKNDFETIYNIGPYRIYSKAQERIDSFYDSLIDSNINPIYFDEVGKLELSHKGLYLALKKALDNNRDIYLTVREDLLSEVVSEFEISEYEIVSR